MLCNESAQMPTSTELVDFMDLKALSVETHRKGVTSRQSP